MAAKKQHIATAKNPTIAAVIDQLFRLESEKQATVRLKQIQEDFITSRDQEKDQSPPSVRLWIKGFGLNDDERKQGFLGHFVLIRYRKLDGRKWTLYAEKELIPLKNHPQKKRPKKKHPDWGHYLMRMVRKKPEFKSLEEANMLLEQLHEMFPEVSIPAKNKLYIIVYTKGAKPPAQKYVLEIKVTEEGKFFIECSENKKAKAKEILQNKAKEETKDKPKGYFTSMVELKRKRRT